MEIDFLKEKTYTEINEMFNQLNDKLNKTKTELNKLRLGNVVLSAYVVIYDKEEKIVMAENVADACDRLEALGVKRYEFLHTRSLDIVVH